MRWPADPERGTRSVREHFFWPCLLDAPPLRVLSLETGSQGVSKRLAWPEQSDEIRVPVTSLPLTGGQSRDGGDAAVVIEFDGWAVVR